MFISIEGIDGVGKTTSATLLANAKNYAYEQKLYGELEEIIDDAKNKGVNEATLHFLYLLSVANQSDRIRRMLAVGKQIIVDRWIGTQAASHHFYCAQKGLDPLPIDYNCLSILQPSLSFLLKADDNIRRSRMEKRGKLFGNDLKSLQPGAQDIFLNTIRKSCPNVIEIDTTTLTQQQVLDSLLIHIL
jgi:thymidylate kinase